MSERAATRAAGRRRTTGETDVEISIDLDGPAGVVEVSTGLPFFDLFAPVPYFFHKWASSIVFFCLNSEVVQLFFQLKCSTKSGNNNNIVRP